MSKLLQYNILQAILIPLNNKLIYTKIGGNENIRKYGIFQLGKKKLIKGGENDVFDKEMKHSLEFAPIEPLIEQLIEVVFI